ncbi:MAG: beta-N-acetylhexosaminidase [Armatimonadota bacterium]
MPIHIYHLDRNQVVYFAMRELKRYLKLMTGEEVKVVRAWEYDPTAPGIWLGMPWQFEKALLLEVANRVPEFHGPDDVIRVRARGGNVAITGANARSLLFGVYRWLEALGCHWLRPGNHGERVPRVADPLALELDLLDAPSTRFRVICIEGSCSIEHVRDMIDYAAKRGFNGYFTQFFNGFTFFDRWYGLEKNRRPERTPFTSKQALKLTDRAKHEAWKRGLMLHTVGHGWTCKPLGLPAEKWAPHTEPVPEVVKPYLAELGGERKLNRGIPLFTHLCYSNPLVRMMVVEGILQYIAGHQGEEVVHTWLADGGNNHCECAECRKYRPADLCVIMLNEIDRALTEMKIKTRLVIPAYVDLMWGPAVERINNPGRFLLMFAPITRSYMRSLAEPGPGDNLTMPPYERNKLAYPADPRANLRMLESWKPAFDGERIIFEYYYWRMHHYDPGQMRMARTLWQDLQGLEALGFTGFISAQAQRVCFPTGVNMHVMGHTLWDRTADFDALVDGYLADLFGDDGPAVRRYLETLTELMDHELLDPADNSRPIDPAKREQALQGWDATPAAVDAFLPVIEAGCTSADPVTAAAWRIMRHHAWYAKAFADLYARAYHGDESASQTFVTLADELDRRLPYLHQVFDTYIAKLMCQHALAMQGLPFEERATVAESAPPPKKEGEPVVAF